MLRWVREFLCGRHHYGTALAVAVRDLEVAGRARDHSVVTLAMASAAPRMMRPDVFLKGLVRGCWASERA
jgi:hypothetical protein